MNIKNQPNTNTLNQTEKFLSTKQLARLLNVSPQWCEIGRCKGYGPPFIRITRGMVRYRLSDVLKWMEARSYTSNTQADVEGVKQ